MQDQKPSVTKVVNSIRREIATYLADNLGSEVDAEMLGEVLEKFDWALEAVTEDLPDPAPRP